MTPTRSVLTPPPMPTSPEERIYLTPESPDKVAFLEEKTQSRHPLETIQQLVSQVIITDEYASHLFFILHDLAHREKKTLGFPQVDLLCEKIGRCLMTHNCAAKRGESDRSVEIGCRCQDAKECLKWMVDNKLPRAIAMKVRDWETSTAIEHILLVLTRANAITARAVDALAANHVEGPAIWLSQEAEFVQMSIQQAECAAVADSAVTRKKRRAQNSK
jgi:hypothetical protein